MHQLRSPGGLYPMSGEDQDKSPFTCRDEYLPWDLTPQNFNLYDRYLDQVVAFTGNVVLRPKLQQIKLQKINEEILCGRI